MAVALPILAGIGGGSAAVGGALLATTVGAGVYAARSQRAAGKAVQAETELEARAEGDAARDREINRKRMLMRALSSQVAAAGAAGVRVDQGSPASLINLDIAEARRDQDIDVVNTRSKQRLLRFRGENARIAGNAAARQSLLDTALRTTQAFL